MELEQRVQCERNRTFVTYLLQLVQRTLSDTALLEVVLRRIHHLLDDLLVDVALSHTVSYRLGSSRALARL